MAWRKESLGGLSCRISSQLPAGAMPRLVVVLCHGFGARGTDLVPIGDELLGLAPELAESAEFIFPEAPLSLDEAGLPGGRAWWHIDMNELIGAIEHGNLRILRDQRPAGMTEARDMLLALLNARQQQTRLPGSRFVLGGFSQGSMLAIDAALNWTDRPGGLCLWSSTLVSEQKWCEKFGRLKGLTVLQSHGRQDPILPLTAAHWLRDRLLEAGLQLQFIEFNGPHTIPDIALERLAEMLGLLV